jgi:hypothetical protein
VIYIVAASGWAAHIVARTHRLHPGEWCWARAARDVEGTRPERVLYGYDANQLPQEVFATIARLAAFGRIGSDHSG